MPHFKLKIKQTLGVLAPVHCLQKFKNIWIATRKAQKSKIIQSECWNSQQLLVGVRKSAITQPACVYVCGHFNSTSIRQTIQQMQARGWGTRTSPDSDSWTTLWLSVCQCDNRILIHWAENAGAAGCKSTYDQYIYMRVLWTSECILLYSMSLRVFTRRTNKCI